MKYEELYNDFKSLFLEDEGFFESIEEETGAGSDDGIHVLFCMNVVPFVKKIVEKKKKKAKRAFDFFEKMEQSEDSKIAEVVEFSVLENLLSEEPDFVNKCAEYFGYETKEAAQLIGKWFKK